MDYDSNEDQELSHQISHKFMGGVYHAVTENMTLLILLRHGESVWNAANLFTGWEDVDLSDEGIKEVTATAEMLSDMPIDVVFTSELLRAQRTASIVMEGHSSGRCLTFGKEMEEAILARTDWRLNERNYGDLQGLNKDVTRAKYGAEQVHIWRRSFDVPPPGGESLGMIAERTIPCFTELILPELEAGKNVLVTAHGNSLRSIVMHIDGLSPEQVRHLEIPTGTPIFYTLEAGSLKPTEA